MHETQVRGRLPARHVRPDSVEEALRLLAGGGAKVIAGGTDLVLEFERHLHPDVETLVDLTAISGNDAVTIGDDHIELGCLVTHGRVASDPELAAIATPLVQACREVGSPQLRNRATIAGNLVTASPANDTISALWVLDAEVVVRSEHGTRVVPIAELYLGVRRTTLRSDELVTAVRLRRMGPAERALFLKVGNRTAQAISVVHAAMVFDGASARVALGSVAPTIVEFRHDGPFDDPALESFARAVEQSLAPIDDVRATADYRRHMIRTTIVRGLRALRDGGLEDTVPVPGLAASVSRMPVGRPGDLGPDDVIVATVNGTAVQASGAGMTLLNWLRDTAGPASGAKLTGTKEGCAEGECGACTVIMDGAAVMSCLVPAAAAHGSVLATVEAGAEDGLDALQRAFVEHGAVQCGFCIPGFIVAGRALLAEVPAPNREQVVDALGGNLCRCTGYYKIIDAVVAAGGPR